MVGVCGMNDGGILARTEVPRQREWHQWMLSAGWRCATIAVPAWGVGKGARAGRTREAEQHVI